MTAANADRDERLGIPGYWVVGADGTVAAYGNAPDLGSLGGPRARRDVVGLASTPDGRGYWLVVADGSVHAFGNAPDLGGLPDLGVRGSALGLVPTPDAGGYWIVGTDGAVFTFGNASYFGGCNTRGERREPVALASTPVVQGYWVGEADGRVHAFGNAGHWGDHSDLDEPEGRAIVALAPTPDGQGHWTLASDGRVHAFGNADAFGGLPDLEARLEAVAMAPTPDGQGYLLLGPSGIVFPFGVATLHESGSRSAVASAVGIAATPAPGVPKLLAAPVALFSTWAEGWLELAPAPDPEASIVIPVHGRSDLTRACLESVAAHTDGVSFEVIVVDDASRDDTPALLRSANGVRVVTNPANAGFLRSCNAGARVARGRYVVFLNNDVIVRHGWLGALVRTADDQPDVGVIGARVVFPDGTLQECGSSVWRDGSTRQHGRGDDPGRPEFQAVRDVDYCSGACLLVRRELFETIGGFDDRFQPAYYEDVDLAFQARERGYRVIVQPEAVVEHHEGGTYGGDESSRRKRAFIDLHRERFVTKWYAALAGRPDAPAHVPRSDG